MRNNQAIKEETDTMPHVLVSIKGVTYGITCEHVDHICNINEVTKVPKQAPHVLGVINYNGRILPLMELRTLFGIPTQQEELGENEELHEIQVVIESPQGSYALVVDKVIGIENLTKPIPGAKKAHYVSEYYARESDPDDIVLAVDLERLFDGKTVDKKPQRKSK